MKTFILSETHLTEPMRTSSIVTEAWKPLHTAEQKAANTTRILGGFFVSVKNAVKMAFTPVFSICREDGEYNTLRGNKPAPTVCGVSNLLAPITLESSRNHIDIHTENIQMNTPNLPFVGHFQRNANITLNLPESSFIERFTAAFNGSAWHLIVHTQKGQTSPLKSPDTGLTAEFSTLDQLAHWLAAQNISEMTVYLPAGNASTMGVAE
ncbi:hypothetical protein [Thiomicrorhabdus indica]|uniref:hypothetical protein n=1 Tax=Thiomicrorhabdus indica TaxID=2267253 RepID=UPI002AA64181|nr:hypothetical protein [Thiomicrorhabdus indica]